MIEKERHYFKYKNMIMKLAFKTYRNFHVPLEDLISEGNYIYNKCLNSYSEEIHRCSFSTYLYNNLQSKLKWYCIRQMKRATINEEIENLNLKYNHNFEEVILFKNSLSEKAKRIVELIYDPTIEFSFFKTNASNLSKYLQKEGWKKQDIQASFAEIAGALRC